METSALSTGGICMLLLLISGTVLTVITIRRMMNGQLCLPGWAKVLLSTGMILLILIPFFSILPPSVIDEIKLIPEETHIVIPSAVPETTATP